MGNLGETEISSPVSEIKENESVSSKFPNKKCGEISSFSAMTAFLK